MTKIRGTYIDKHGISRVVEAPTPGLYYDLITGQFVRVSRS